MLHYILLFPLFGFLINGLWYAFFQTSPGAKKASSLTSGTIATLGIFLSFIASVMTFVNMLGMPAEGRVIEQVLFSWIHVGDLSIDFALRADPLNILFCLVITGVGSLIHLYSIGYMGSDESPGKFFTYLNLFCFSMLILVLGASMPMTFVGWEGVGLCSYLLISFWYTDEEKAKAGKKAFVVNRIGDFGFLLGMFFLFTNYGSLDYAVLHQTIAGGTIPVAEATITLIVLLLFLGCTGKSAQIPLFVWLPDAMAGPTPVSALIHAATMVTSGIYLLARMNYLVSMSPTAMCVIATTGAVTALFAATIAVAQSDIKKVLAYSTVSQLGFMFLGVGVGGYVSGVFHVITHAFFKALMFLGAGSVIHGMHHEQNIWKMGGLKKQMPTTYFTFLMGLLAICGIPPFSGFFSKDEILWLTFSSEHGSKILWAIAAMTAVMTAFYMTRMFSLTFLGTGRYPGADHSHGTHGHDKKHANHGKKANSHTKHGHDDHGHSSGQDDHSGHGDHGDHGHVIHPHESPLTMTLPLMILAVLSVAGGFLGIPHASWLEHWLEPVIPAHALPETVNHSMEWVLMAVSTIGGIVGIFAALKVYADLKNAKALKERFSGLHKILENKWYVDEIYEALFVRPTQTIARLTWRIIDVGVIDRVVLTFGRVTQFSGQVLRVFHTGSIQAYAFFVLMGVFATLGYLIYGIH